MKYTIVSALALVMALGQFTRAELAEQMRYCPRGGYCPPGTCVKFNPWARHQYACNVANCSATNCVR